MPESTRDEIAKLQEEYAKNPEGRLFVRLADAYRRGGDASRARELLRQGLEHHPDYVSAHVVLAEVQAEMGEEDEADASWRGALELDPENENALRGLAALETRRGRRDEALDYLGRLRALGIEDEQTEELMAALTGNGAGQDEGADEAAAAPAATQKPARGGKSEREREAPAQAVAPRAADSPPPAGATDAIGLSDLLVRLLEFHDSTFHAQSSLTRVLALAIGRELELERVHLEGLSLGALLSDLGGLALTGMPSGLRDDTHDQRRAEQREVAVSLQLLDGISLPPGVHEAIRHQHERWDGTGYPDGLRDEEIPYGARVLAIARACATMLTSNGAGRTATVVGALDELQRNAGSRFDPVVVSVLRRVFQRRSEHGIGYGLGGHVVIVHPEELRTLGLATQLHESGYVTEMSAETSRARESLRGRVVKAIVLGAGLPVNDLSRFVRDVRANPASATIPVIVIDANDMNLRVEMLTAGADVCFPSEVTFREFKATLDALLRRTEEGGTPQEVGYRPAEGLA